MAKLYKERIEQSILTGLATAVSEFVYVDVGHVMAVIGKEKTVEICKLARGLEEVDLKTDAQIAAGDVPEIKELGIGKFDRLELLAAMGYEIEVKPEDRPKLVVPAGLTKKTTIETSDQRGLVNPPAESDQKVVVNSSTVSADAVRNAPNAPVVPPNVKPN